MRRIVERFPAPYSSAVLKRRTQAPYSGAEFRRRIQSLFLALNGYRLTAGQVDVTQTMLAVAVGDLIEVEFSGWIRGSSKKR